MKTLKTNSFVNLIPALLTAVSINVWAAESQPSVSRLELGETFLLSDAKTIRSVGFHHEPNYWDSPRIYGITYSLDFMSFAVQTKIPAAPPYFNTKEVFNLFSSNTRRSNWDDALAERDAMKALAPYDQVSPEIRLSLDRMDDAGTSILANYFYRNDALVALNHIKNGESVLKIPAKLILSECRDARGVLYSALGLAARGTGEKFNEAVKEGRIADLVYALRDQEPLSLETCRFEVARSGIPSEFLTGIHNLSIKTHETHWNSDKELLTIVKADPNRLISSGKGEFRGNYVREKITENPAAEQAALQAGQEYTTFIQEEYGGLLYGVMERKVSDGEKRELIRSFFRTNKPRMDQWFATMNQNYAAVSLLNKVSLLTGIASVYQKVDAIEKVVQKLPSDTLARVIKQYK